MHDIGVIRRRDAKREQLERRRPEKREKREKTRQARMSEHVCEGKPSKL